MSYIIDEGGGDPSARQYFREWVLTGKIEKRVSADETLVSPTTGEILPDSQQPKVEVARGVRVSQNQMDVFAEMGGTMRRRERS